MSGTSSQTTRERYGSDRDTSPLTRHSSACVLRWREARRRSVVASVLRATHTTRSSSFSERGGSRGSETRHLISASSRLQNIEPPRWFQTRTRPLALFPIAFFPYATTPDRIGITRECIKSSRLRYTAPLAPSIYGTWHKPPPRFSQRPPSALCSKLLSDRREPPTTTPCIPPLIAPHRTRRCLFRVTHSHRPLCRSMRPATRRSARSRPRSGFACVRRGGATCHMKDRMKHHIDGRINNHIQGSHPKIGSKDLVTDL